MYLVHLNAFLKQIWSSLRLAVKVYFQYQSVIGLLLTDWKKDKQYWN